MSTQLFHHTEDLAPATASLCTPASARASSPALFSPGRASPVHAVSRSSRRKSSVRRQHVLHRALREQAPDAHQAPLPHIRPRQRRIGRGARSDGQHDRGGIRGGVGGGFCEEPSDLLLIADWRGVDLSEDLSEECQNASRKVDAKLPAKGNSNSHGARPVHLIITIIKWFRTSRLTIKSLSLQVTSSSATCQAFKDDQCTALSR